MCRGKIRDGRNKHLESNLQHVHAVSEDQEDEYVFSVGENKSKPIFHVRINGVNINMMANTGAAVNPIDEVVYGNISVIRRLPLQDTNVKCIHTEALNCVVRGKYGNLFSCLTAQQLKLVVLSNQVLSVNTDHPPAISAILNTYKDVFSGIGKLKDFTVKIHVNKDVTRVVQSYRSSDAEEEAGS